MSDRARFGVRSRAGRRGREWSVADYATRPPQVAPAPDEAAARRACAELNAAWAAGHAVRWTPAGFQIAAVALPLGER